MLSTHPPLPPSSIMWPACALPCTPVIRVALRLPTCHYWRSKRRLESITDGRIKINQSEPEKIHPQEPLRRPLRWRYRSPALGEAIDEWRVQMPTKYYRHKLYSSIKRPALQYIKGRQGVNDHANRLSEDGGYWRGRRLTVDHPAERCVKTDATTER